MTTRIDINSSQLRRTSRWYWHGHLSTNRPQSYEKYALHYPFWQNKISDRLIVYDLRHEAHIHVKAKTNYSIKYKLFFFCFRHFSCGASITTWSSVGIAIEISNFGGHSSFWGAYLMQEKLHSQSFIVEIRLGCVIIFHIETLLMERLGYLSYRSPFSTNYLTLKMRQKSHLTWNSVELFLFGCPSDENRKHKTNYSIKYKLFFFCLDCRLPHFFKIFFWKFFLCIFSMSKGPMQAIRARCALYAAA